MTIEEEAVFKEKVKLALKQGLDLEIEVGPEYAVAGNGKWTNIIISILFDGDIVCVKKEALDLSAEEFVKR